VLNEYCGETKSFRSVDFNTWKKFHGDGEVRVINFVFFPGKLVPGANVATRTVLDRSSVRIFGPIKFAA
jgi:hypothetical protein